MTEETKPEQDAMTPGRRAFEAFNAALGNHANPELWRVWTAETYKAAWEAAAAAVIAGATKGGE